MAVYGCADGSKRQPPLLDSAHMSDQPSRLGSAEQSVSQAEAAFIGRYLGDLSSADLRDLPPERRQAIAGHHFRLARSRQRGTPLLRVRALPVRQPARLDVIECVADDMPFLVDSLSMELARRGLTILGLVHPVMAVRRDDTGTLQTVAAAGHFGAGHDEAVMRFEIRSLGADAPRAALEQALLAVLEQVRLAVTDWQAMRARLLERAAQVQRHAPREAEFLHWCAADNFTFLAALDGAVQQGGWWGAGGSELGLQRLPDGPDADATAAPAETGLQLSKSVALSPVHRNANFDVITVPRLDNTGRCLGFSRFHGLYTSTVYTTSVREIPLLREKCAEIMAQAGFPERSHAGKALQHVLETLPRDEMLQASTGHLYDVAIGALQARDRTRLRLFVRVPAGAPLATALAFVPRELYDTRLRILIEDLVRGALDGERVSFSTRYSEGSHVQVYMIVQTPRGVPAQFDLPALERAAAECMLGWHDRLQALLPEHLAARWTRYQNAFSPAYQSEVDPEAALRDLDMLVQLEQGMPLAVWLQTGTDSGEATLHLCGPGEPLELSALLPLLEHFGLWVSEANTYDLHPRGGAALWAVHVATRLPPGCGDHLPDAVLEAFRTALTETYLGNCESDGFNRLVLAAEIGWREVMLLRALCRYLVQTQNPFSLVFMQDALGRHPVLVRGLLELFAVRFDPARDEDAQAEAACVRHIEAGLEQVESLDDDRVIRALFSVVRAMQRTSYYQRDDAGAPAPYLALKLHPRGIPGLPEPVPAIESFVYAPRFEGVHLRGGRVARGGLRWSDRSEDYRSEVFGLMKAQMVKNAVIVPVGAKGGFIVRRQAELRDRGALQAEVLACYRQFVSGLLDLVDNLDGDRVITPERTRAHDGPDTYLVVAADKGTATFSDEANAVARQRGFWLGDAFASGGSAGYDHKKMGITARGAWESVLDHFRELGIDPQRTAFSVVGIGDMGGDVFGNGMLRSRQIRLVAAFNHRHIFIDPDPPEEAYDERARLFAQPGLGWGDYRPELISAGGGVWPRSAKRIELSEQAAARLGAQAQTLTPAELIRLILRAPVDLLWNGGIGTYVKAADESHAGVADRGNDALRVDAAELRCRCVGEGGNLGFTQAARVEYALGGGLINTDAVDNSGGVDCSDHEVNIKILLRAAMRAGELPEQERDALLEDMTEAVAERVLQHNAGQARALSLAAAQPLYLLDEQRRFADSLAAQGRLDLRREVLPDHEELALREADGRGYQRPELALLLGHAKLSLHDQLVDTDLVDDPWFAACLQQYFPQVLQERFAGAIANHSLRRELLATHLCNAIINRMGATFVPRIREDSGDSAEQVVRAYCAAQEIFETGTLWHEVEQLDLRIPAATQNELFVDIRRLLDISTLWLLRYVRAPLDVGATVRRFGPAMREVEGGLHGLPQRRRYDLRRQRLRRLARAGVPEALAYRIVELESLYSALDIVDVASRSDRPVLRVATAYLELARRLDLRWLREAVSALPRHSYWERKSRAALRDELYVLARALTAQMVADADPAHDARTLVDRWLEQHRAAVEPYRQRLAEIRTGKAQDLAGLTVALRTLKTLRRRTTGEP